MHEDDLSVLVVASFDGCDARAIADFLFSFNAYSRHRYYYVLDCRRLGGEVDLAAFDVIVIFWSASLLGPSLGGAIRERLRAAPALKVVFAQDEYRDVRRLDAALAEVGAGVVFTCVAAADRETFYPDRLIPTLTAVYSILPAYVPQYLERRAQFDRSRPLDVGYRSRVPPYYLGDLARAKVSLAERFGVACREHGLRADISVRELDRLYGAAWLRFLASCRCALGSPSGASVIDFTGEIRRSCEGLLARHPEASYEEVRSRHFAAVDGAHVIDTVSARVFESVAMGCAPVLVEGHYGGVLEADTHYIRVARDYSNLPGVLDRVTDRAFCRRLAESVHAELIASGRYSFRSFVARFDACLDRHARRVRRRTLGRAAFHATRCLAHGQPFVPLRAGYVAPPLNLAFLGFALRRVAHGGLRPGPILGRALRNPPELMRKLIDLASLLARVPPMRRLLAVWAGEPGVRAAAPLSQLLEDLLKIDVVRRARAGTLRGPLPFTVAVSHEADTGTMLLTSTPASGAPPLDAAPLGAVRHVVWDHGHCGLEVTLETRRGRLLTLSLGDGGVYRFQAISTLCRLAPAHTLAALGRLLAISPDTSAGPRAERV